MRNLSEHPLKFDEVAQSLQNAQRSHAEKLGLMCGSIDGVALQWLKLYVERHREEITDELINDDQPGRNRVYNYD